MRYFIFIFFVLFMSACKKDTDGPTTVLNEMPSAEVISQNVGYFMNGPYGAVSGKAQVLKITEGNYEIVLDSFMSSNGPDLYVYLSKETMPVNFIEAGKLKSTNGRQVYQLSTTADISPYKYVCIHCKAYNHLFGSALIK